MVINNNPMNPVPLWTSKNDWYCKKATNHGNCVHPVVPNGMMPKMALTLQSSNLPEGDEQTITIFTNENNPPFFIENNSEYSGAANPSKNDGISLEYLGAYPTGTLIRDVEIKMVPVQKGQYKVTIEMEVGITHMAYNVFPVGGSEGDLIPQSSLEHSDINLIVRYEGTPVQFRISSVNFSYISSGNVSVKLVKYNENTTVTTKSMSYEIIGCGDFYNTTHAACMWIGGGNFTGTLVDGVYYCEFAIDGTTYYTEPFMWLTNLNQYLHVIYRRSTPVVTTDNCIVFEYNGTTRQLESWLPGLLLMPPFTFNDEVDEVDGRKFTRKQVSYKDEKCEFMCTAYFAEAIRLLWHCDIRTAGGMRVEYMVRPEIDWNTDNHLCDVKLEFQGDTVMQTNGTASAYGDSSDSSHQSYDASFDASFQ